MKAKCIFIIVDERDKGAVDMEGTLPCSLLSLGCDVTIDGLTYTVESAGVNFDKGTALFHLMANDIEEYSPGEINRIIEKHIERGFSIMADNRPRNMRSVGSEFVK